MARRKTQREQVLQYINDFGSITRAQAFMDLGIAELAARICELQKEGYSFNKKQESAINRYGDRVYFTKYSLAERS